MRQDRKIDFVIGGIQKCGTSALHQMLSKHPDIYLPEQKELHFFDHTARFRLDCFKLYRSLLYLKYHSYFRKAKNEKILGDATVDYMFWHTAPGNIWRYNPNMKWIILLRNPVYRARSAWSMNVERNHETKDFEAALAADVQRSKSTLPYQNHMYSYLDRGRYACQIRRLLTMFARDQILFLTTNELRNHHGQILSDVQNFLGLEKFELEQKMVRIGTRYPSLDREIYSSVIREFEWDIRETSELIGKDLTDWIAQDYTESSGSV